MINLLNMFKGNSKTDTNEQELNEKIKAIEEKYDKKEQDNRSSKVLKNRLTIVLEQDRTMVELPFVNEMKKEILEVIQKYVNTEDMELKINNKTDKKELVEFELMLNQKK